MKGRATLIDTLIQLGNSVTRFQLIMDENYDGVSSSGHFRLPYIFDVPPEKRKPDHAVGDMYVVFHPELLADPAGKTDILAVIIHEIAEYSAAANGGIIKKAFQREKYGCSRRTLVLDHDTTFCDMCDELGDGLGQIWGDLNAILRMTREDIFALLHPEDDKKKKVKKRGKKSTKKG